MAEDGADPDGVVAADGDAKTIGLDDFRNFLRKLKSEILDLGMFPAYSRAYLYTEEV